MTQLDLFAPPVDGPEPTDLTFLAMCSRCEQPIAAVPVEGGPGAPWRAAESWCYVALKAHEKICPATQPEPGPARPTG